MLNFVMILVMTSAFLVAQDLPRSLGSLYQALSTVNSAVPKSLRELADQLVQWGRKSNINQASSALEKQKFVDSTNTILEKGLTSDVD